MELSVCVYCTGVCVEWETFKYLSKQCSLWFQVEAHTMTLVVQEVLQT